VVLRRPHCAALAAKRAQPGRFDRAGSLLGVEPPPMLYSGATAP